MNPPHTHCPAVLRGRGGEREGEGERERRGRGREARRKREERERERAEREGEKERERGEKEDKTAHGVSIHCTSRDPVQDSSEYNPPLTAIPESLV